MPHPLVMDKREIDGIKRSLMECCNDFLDGALTEEALGRRARALMVTNGHNPYNLSLLLKRVEKTCGKHICGFWNECSSGCQYNEQSSMTWEEDVAMFNKLDTKVRQTSKSVSIMNANASQRMDALEAELKKANEKIGELETTVVSERKARESLQSEMLDLQQRMQKVEFLYEQRAVVQHGKIEQLGTALSPFKSIPVVDLSLPIEQVAANVGRACREVGFMYITNHGVEQHIMDQAFDLAKQFFNLPMEKKMEVSNTSSRSGIRGYFCLGEEDLNAKDGVRDLSSSEIQQYKGDFKEGFDCGREVAANDPDLSCPLVDFNQWPEAIPGFQAGIMEYQNAVLSAAEKLMVAFAIGLGLPSDFFVKRMQKPMTTLRLLHYPPQAPKDLNDVDQIGCGAHSDYGCCTFLNQDEVGGLQVLNSNDEWIDAPPMPGAFVINIGDMMSRWTNGSYTSTIHRVVNTSGRERYSIPLFLNPDVGTAVQCLDSCIDAEHPALYPPAESQDILLARYEETFAHVKKSNQ